jgi:hypothetical protein
MLVSVSVLKEVSCQNKLLINRCSLLCSFEPLLAANEHRIEGEKLASSAGDVHFVCRNR